MKIHKAQLWKLLVLIKALSGLSWGICSIWFLIFGRLPWQMIWIAIIGSNGNIIHLLDTMFKSEKPRIVTWLQKMRVIQNPAQHASHHTKPEERILHHNALAQSYSRRTRILFKIEYLIERLFGIVPNSRLQELHD